MRVSLNISYNSVEREQNCTKGCTSIRKKAEDVLHV